MKIDMIQVLADRKELQKIQQRMNTNFSISEIEVKICPDCGAEHIADTEQCDICTINKEINEALKLSTELIKAFEI